MRAGRLIVRYPARSAQVYCGGSTRQRRGIRVYAGFPDVGELCCCFVKRFDGFSGRTVRDDAGHDRLRWLLPSPVCRCVCFGDSAEFSVNCALVGFGCKSPTRPSLARHSSIRAVSK